MKLFTQIHRISLILALTLLPHLALAADVELSISEPSFLDKQYMDQQRSQLDELARSSLGRQFSQNKSNDLGILQALLDRGVVRPEQKQQLQAMGIIMGDLFARELNMHWVIYEDKVGRSRALRYQQTDNYLFPMTMISSRREVDNLTSVRAIYQRAADGIKPLLPKMPYQ